MPIGGPLRCGEHDMQPASEATLAVPSPVLNRTPRKWPEAPGAWTAGISWLAVSVAVSRYAAACTAERDAAAAPTPSTMPVATIVSRSAELDERAESCGVAFLMFVPPFREGT